MSEKEEDRCFQLECIDVYRQLPALWKVKSDDYSDRKKKDAAYAVLVEKFKEKYPNYTRDDVKKKLIQDKLPKRTKKSAGFGQIWCRDRAVI